MSRPSNLSDGSRASCVGTGEADKSLLAAITSLRDELLNRAHSEHDGAISLEEVHYFCDLVRQSVAPRYQTLPEALVAREQTLADADPTLHRLFVRILLAQLLISFRAQESGDVRLPNSILELYPRETARIGNQILYGAPDVFDLTKDAWLKDLAILSHRLIPVGAEYAELRAGVPRSILFTGGPKQFMAALRLLGWRPSGYRPFAQLHAHVLALEDFNPDGWHKTYLRLADLLAVNPWIKGWFSGSWFLDPQLDAISPRLSYLRTFPQQHGAAIFFVKLDTSGSTGALARSETRRKLFHEGAYVPAIHMRVWLRDDVMAWARQAVVADRHATVLSS